MPEIFEYIKRLAPGKDDEVQLTDAIRRLVESEEVYACVVDGVRYDTGNKTGYLKAVLTFVLEDDELKDEVLSYLQYADS